MRICYVACMVWALCFSGLYGLDWFKGFFQRQEPQPQLSEETINNIQTLIKKDAVSMEIDGKEFSLDQYNQHNYIIDDQDHETILHQAAYHGSDEVINNILNNAQNVNINIENRVGKTPLHLAAQSDKQGTLEAMKIILNSYRNKVEVNKKDQYENTPLHYAVNLQEGQKPGDQTSLQKVEKLISNDADLTIKNTSKNDPVQKAIEQYKWIHNMYQSAQTITQYSQEELSRYQQELSYISSLISVLIEHYPLEKVYALDVSRAPEDIQRIIVNKKVKPSLHNLAKSLNYLHSQLPASS